MGGQLNNMSIVKAETVLLKWVLNRLETKDWNKFTDFHITEFKDLKLAKSDWLNVGLELMSSFYNDFEMQEHILLLAIPLNCTKESKKENEYIDLSDLDNDVNSSPPSFYLFPRNSENLEVTLKSSKKLIKLSDNWVFKFYYNEKQEGDEFYRTVFVTI